jgi:hypothetical protein
VPLSGSGFPGSPQPNPGRWPARFPDSRSGSVRFGPGRIGPAVSKPVSRPAGTRAALLELCPQLAGPHPISAGRPQGHEEQPLMPADDTTRRRHALLVDVTRRPAKSAASSTKPAISTCQWSPVSAKVAMRWFVGRSCSKRSFRNGLRPVSAFSGAKALPWGRRTPSVHGRGRSPVSRSRRRGTRRASVGRELPRGLAVQPTGPAIGPGSELPPQFGPGHAPGRGEVAPGSWPGQLYRPEVSCSVSRSAAY